MTNFCKDCKHFTKFFLEPKRFGKCKRTKTTGPNYYLVDGKGNLNDMNYCSCERVSYSTIDTCGKEAIYFEAKK